jgi:hypothetical protein
MENNNVTAIFLMIKSIIGAGIFIYNFHYTF